jgi:hypothetical protein
MQPNEISLRITLLQYTAPIRLLSSAHLHIPYERQEKKKKSPEQKFFFFLFLNFFCTRIFFLPYVFSSGKGCIIYFFIKPARWFFHRLKKGIKRIGYVDYNSLRAAWCTNFNKQFMFSCGDNIGSDETHRDQFSIK